MRHGRRRGIYIPRVEIIEYHNATILQESHGADKNDQEKTILKSSYECLIDSSELPFEHIQEGPLNNPFILGINENYLKRVFKSV